MTTTIAKAAAQPVENLSTRSAQSKSSDKLNGLKPDATSNIKRTSEGSVGKEKSPKSSWCCFSSSAVLESVADNTPPKTKEASTMLTNTNEASAPATVTVESTPQDSSTAQANPFDAMMGGFSGGAQVGEQEPTLQSAETENQPTKPKAKTLPTVSLKPSTIAAMSKEGLSNHGVMNHKNLRRVIRRNPDQAVTQGLQTLGKIMGGESRGIKETITQFFDNQAPAHAAAICSLPISVGFDPNNAYGPVAVIHNDMGKTKHVPHDQIKFYAVPHNDAKKELLTILDEQFPDTPESERAKVVTYADIDDYYSAN